MTWTMFHDMSSGGGHKTDYCLIAMEATEDVARRAFADRFDLDPDYVTCDCCGQDYWVIERHITDPTDEASRWGWGDEKALLIYADGTERVIQAGLR